MPSAHSASPEKTKGKMRNERAILAAVLVAMALPSLFVAAFLFHHGNNAFQPDPLREGAAACGHSSVSGSAGQQYQYEGNPCHILYSNSSVSAFNYTLSGGVDAAVALHDGLLLVPMSQPMNNLPLPSVSSSGTTDPLPTLNSAFIRPSYFPPSYWNFNGTWGKLAAYDAITGKLLWEDNFSAPVMSQPIVVNGTAYISTGDDFVNNAYKRNGIYAINLSTGRIAWSYPTVAEHMPTPLYYNGTLIILPGAGTGYDSNSVFALDSGTGLPLWHIGIGAESAMSSPALVGNTMYFGARFYGGNFTAVNYYNTSANNTFPSGYSAFFAVNLDSRKMVWSTAFSIGMGPEDMPPAVWNGIVVGGYAQTFGNSSALGTDLAPGGNVMPINRTTLDAYLIGMNSTTGKILWKIDEGKGTNPPRAKLSAPTIYEGIVYSDGDTTGILYAVNASTGKVIWNFRTGPGDANPAVADNHVLAINQTGTLFALDMNGTLVSERNLGLSMGWCGSGQLYVMGDKLAIGGENGKLLVLPLSSILPTKS